MAIEIIPGINTSSKVEFEKLLRLIEPHTDWIQVDVHDGTLFPMTTLNDPRSVGALTPEVNIELHLMVENPLEVAKKWHEHVPQVKRVIFHAEMDRQHGPIIEELKHLGYEVGIAINPETPIEEVNDVLSKLDELLIMTVHPGGSGQGMGDEKHGINTEDLVKKAADIHNRYPELILAIDGGANADTIPSFIKAGVTRFAATSAVFGQDDVKQALQQLNEL